MLLFALSLISLYLDDEFYTDKSMESILQQLSRPPHNFTTIIGMSGEFRENDLSFFPSFTGVTNLTFLSEAIILDSPPSCPLLPGLEYVLLMNQSNVTHSLFRSSAHLQIAVLPNTTKFSTRCFESCIKLHTVDSPLVESIDSAFINCSSLVNLTHNCSYLYSISFYRCISLETVAFPNLKCIDEATFAYCSSLVLVDLPNVITIDKRGFYHCMKLHTILCPKCQSIGAEAFYFCPTLRNFSATQVVSLGTSAFFSCPSLPRININTPSIPDHAFAYCDGLQSIFDERATSTGVSAFTGCVGLAYVELLNLHSVGTDCFEDCNSLQSVHFPQLLVLNMLSFSKCLRLRHVYIPLVTSIPSHCFSGCFALHTVESTSLISVGSKAFLDCHSLEQVDLDDLIDLGESAFENCQSLTTVYANDLLEIPKDAFSFSMIVTFEGVSVEHIAREAFIHCDFLSMISIPSCLTIGQEAFRHTLSLHRISVPLCTKIEKKAFLGSSLMGINAPNLTSIGEQALSSTQISVLDLPNLRQIDEFGCVYCDDLVTVSAPYLTTIGNHAFMACISLLNFSFDNVREIGTGAFINTSLRQLEYHGDIVASRSFFNCMALYSIEVHRAWRIESYAFAQCNNLILVYAPAVTHLGDFSFAETGLDIVDFPALYMIGTGTFSDCFNMLTAQFDFVDAIGDCAFSRCFEMIFFHAPRLIEVGIEAFFECESLTELTTPKLETIGNSAFESCTSLHIIDWAPIMTISTRAFALCTNFTTLNLSQSTIASDAFYGTVVTSLFLSNVDVNLVNFNQFQCLEYVDLGTATELSEFLFYSHPALRTVVGNSVVRILAPNVFTHCAHLTEVHLPMLSEVKPKSPLFTGTNLTTLILGPNPPALFHPDTFKNLSVNLVLPDPKYYPDYDDNTDVEGDKRGDSMWCGIRLDYSRAKAMSTEMIFIISAASILFVFVMIIVIVLVVRRIYTRRLDEFESRKALSRILTGNESLDI